MEAAGKSLPPFPLEVSVDELYGYQSSDSEKIGQLLLIKGGNGNKPTPGIIPTQTLRCQLIQK
jgi:hypothetical protein